jgi:large subunit ribosomal protein L18
MESSKLKILELKRKRSIRVRKKIQGTKAKPRLCIIKSNSHIEAQLIDDENSQTLYGVSTRNKELRQSGFGKKSRAAAEKIGELISKAAKEQNVEKMVFDRGPSKYHGILATLADTVRKHGVKL